MYKKSTSSLLADCSILSLITIRQMIAIRTEFIGLMIIVVLALGIMFMPGLSMAEQIEPTVSCNEGSEPVGISYGDRTTDCDIDPPTDLDRFEFCGTAGDEVRLNVFAATDPMDPLVEIWDSVATVLAQASCGGLCTVAVDITLPANDCYTIFVSDVNTDEIGDYTLQLEKIQPVPGSAVELIYDTPVADTIGSATDIDYYTFDATAGTDIRVNVYATGDPMDPVIEIRDPNGIAVVNGVADGAACGGICTFSVDLSPEVTGTYSLLIYDSNIDEPGSYELSIWCLFGACGSTGPMVSYVTPRADVIDSPLDVDLFSFNGTAGTDIRVNVLATADPMDPVIEIRDPNGIVVVNGVADGAACGGICTFSVDLSPEVTGTYSLLIYDSNIDEPGSYELGLWCLFGPCDSDADGILDGDPPVSINTSAVLAYGVPSIDTISPNVDGDIFIFGGTAGDLIRFNVRATADPMDPVIEIRDPNGIVVVNGVADGAACGGICTFSVDLSPEVTGTYSLLIYDSNIDEPGSYEIGLQCLLGTCANVLPVCGDNCIDIANGPLILDPGGNVQRDTDGDGYGNICDPDLDNDLIVNVADLALLKSVFFRPDPDADLNGDGIVNVADLAIMKKLFFLPPGPSCIAP